MAGDTGRGWGTLGQATHCGSPRPSPWSGWRWRWVSAATPLPGEAPAAKDGSCRSAAPKDANTAPGVVRGPFPASRFLRALANAGRRLDKTSQGFGLRYTKFYRSNLFSSGDSRGHAQAPVSRGPVPGGPCRPPRRSRGDGHFRETPPAHSWNCTWDAHLCSGPSVPLTRDAEGSEQSGRNHGTRGPRVLATGTVCTRSQREAEGQTGVAATQKGSTAVDKPTRPGRPAREGRCAVCPPDRESTEPTGSSFVLSLGSGQKLGTVTLAPPGAEQWARRPRLRRLGSETRHSSCPPSRGAPPSSQAASWLPAPLQAAGPLIVQPSSRPAALGPGEATPEPGTVLWGGAPDCPEARLAGRFRHGRRKESQETGPGAAQGASLVSPTPTEPRQPDRHRLPTHGACAQTGCASTATESPPEGRAPGWLFFPRRTGGTLATGNHEPLRLEIKETHKSWSKEEWRQNEDLLRTETAARGGGGRAPDKEAGRQRSSRGRAARGDGQTPSHREKTPQLEAGPSG